jgi:hypothetical protein
MKHLKGYGLVLFAASYVACAPTKFEQQPTVSCVGDNCVTIVPGRVVTQTVRASGGLVDILIVNDNSGSMSFEQSRMAERFSSFVSALDSRQIDYRIAITTTDISSSANPARAINGYGALQDGKLIPFGGANGPTFITNQTAGRDQLFAQTIVRNETLQCENFLRANVNADTTSASYQQGILANCPSGDERGIAAASRALQNSAFFIRPNAHLAIVFLADEDVRSGLYAQSLSYALSAEDLPQNLIASVNSRFPGKTLSVHSILVRPGSLKAGVSASQAATQISQIAANGRIDTTKRPTEFFNSGDSGCLNEQSNQVNAGSSNAVRGSYGYLYALASRMTNGIEGDICAQDYGSQLYDIGFNIVERLREVTLFCSNPTEMTVSFVPEAAITYVVSGNKLTFSQELPVGTRADLSYRCSAQ